MKITNKADFSYVYKNSDYKIILDYLNEAFKRSTASYKSQKSTILNLLNYLNKNLQEITMVDIKDYFDNVIDLKINKRNNNPIGLNSKETYRSYLCSFFDYIIGRFLEDNIEFRNPVPNKRIYKFTQLESDIQKRSNINDEIFTEQELLEILNLSKKKGLRDFILYSLLIIVGARISEILTLKIENINFKERYFETGFVKDSRNCF